MHQGSLVLRVISVVDVLTVCRVLEVKKVTGVLTDAMAILDQEVLQDHLVLWVLQV